MRSTGTWLALAAGLGLASHSRAATDSPVPEASTSPYMVVWDSPSEDHFGSVPLGNGEVAVNAWIEPTGDLRFYLARTDSWDDNGRLVKVGAVRVRLDRSPPVSTQPFHQVLDARSGSLTARFGEGEAQVELRLWVDALRPVVWVEVRALTPATATATVELWRTSQETLSGVEVSDVFCGRPDKTVVEPDALLTGLKDRVGWYHRNLKSVGPELCAKIQGVADFVRPDPLLHRTFGGLIAAARPERLDERALRSGAGTEHVFAVYVHTQHPATAESWLAEATTGLDQAVGTSLAEQRAAHQKWWAEFWGRSWIHITGSARVAGSPPARAPGYPPVNALPVLIGRDQAGGSRFSGEFGRVGIYQTALADTEIASLADGGPQATPPEHPARLYAAVPQGPTDLPQLTACTFANGLTIEAWIRPEIQGSGGGMRIVDKITPGAADGFLLDAFPGPSLRVIVGSATLIKQGVLATGKWQHVACTVVPRGAVKAFLDGKVVAAADGRLAEGQITEGDDAFVVSRAYALQRYVAACAGRGRYPIKFNGSLFTVPAEGGPGGPDYRRWGPGYWWQNTRLPYYSMCTSGDFEMLEPLFRMYGRDLMPLFQFRTRHYLGHDGAYIPECIYFWGDMFTETYGWQPCSERQDKLQASRWHKWEWVSGLELTGLMLDFYEHTEDATFLAETALPVAHQVLTFFDQHYRTGPDGKLVMHPAQALETWWDCLNPMPELAGLHAITARLLALPDARTTPAQRTFWTQLQAKLPPVPTTRTPDGVTMLAPAQEFKQKQNCENPELYAVFPFRLFAIGKPNLDWAVEALNRRADKGAMGWRQDDIFMAWLGRTDAARDYVVKRARSKNAGSRFPVFWGPNYDWVPDQDHGSVLLKTVQSMLLQTEGRLIHLLPAWPQDWNCEFRLRAPCNTTVSGAVEKGKLVRLEVHPETRRQDLRLPETGR